MTIGAFAVSLRVGEIRLTDIAAQLGDAEEFTVRVLDSTGTEHEISLRWTSRWGHTAWRRELECPTCRSAARVLRLKEAHTVCGRCSPHLTAHHRYKNSARWRFEGASLDELLRSATNTRRPMNWPKKNHAAARLRASAIADAAGTIETARDFIAVVDSARISRTR